MIEKMIRVGRLYDIYGELLTDRQRKCLEMHYFQDLSLGEIAADMGVTRQAINDLLRRSEDTMEQYEAVLMLLQKKQLRQDGIKRIKKLLAEIMVEDVSSKTSQLWGEINLILDQEVGTE